MDLRLQARIQALRRGAPAGALPRCRRAAPLAMTAETHSHPPTEPLAAHESARRGGSIVMVLLVAAGIVAVAVVLMTIGRAQAQPYILGLLALLAMVGLFNLFAFAAGIVRFADRTADDPVIGRIADHSQDGMAVTDSKRAHRLFQCRLSGADGGRDRAGRAAGRARLHRQSRCLGGGVPSAQGRARGQAATGGGPRRGQRQARTAAGSGCGFARSARASARRNTRCGRSPTSRATASARRTCSRNCSTRSNISITRRAASSRSTRPAMSSTSTRRWRTGSITTWPKSDRAGSSSPTSFPATARRC